MKYRRLGKTDIKVSVIGFGGIPLQRIDVEASREVVVAALAAGINFFDTGRNYADSEYKLGQALKGHREDSIVATKSMARTKETMAAEVTASLETMELEYIDLYQLHNVPTMEQLQQVMGPKGALEALVEAKAKGLIKHIGITSHIKDVIKEAIKYDVIETIQFPFNAVEPEGVEEILGLARTADIGVIVMKPLAGGALTNTSSAFKYILSHPVTTAIPGMDSLEQVQANAQVGSGEPVLSDGERQVLEAEAAQLGKTFCRRCEYCQPCPEGVNIPVIFLLEGYLERYNLPQWSKDRYAGMPVKIDACLECGECESKCPYDLPIREMLQRAKSKLEVS